MEREEEDEDGERRRGWRERIESKVLELHRMFAKEGETLLSRAHSVNYFILHPLSIPALSLPLSLSLSLEIVILLNSLCIEKSVHSALASSLPCNFLFLSFGYCCQEKIPISSSRREKEKREKRERRGREGEEREKKVPNLCLDQV